jgi:hypothetical protein
MLNFSFSTQKLGAVYTSLDGPSNRTGSLPFQELRKIMLKQMVGLGWVQTFLEVNSSRLWQPRKNFRYTNQRGTYKQPQSV